jgi:hypothetical protein
MAFKPRNESHLWRLGTAIGIGCIIAAGLISTSKIVHDQAKWHDWFIVSSCAFGSVLAGSAVLVLKWSRSLEGNSETDDWGMYASESEMSYMNWRGHLLHRRSMRYQVGKNPLITDRHQGSVDTTSRKQPVLPHIQRIQPQDCRDLGILDTQWAELCAHDTQLYYLRFLSQGVTPQEAFERAAIVSKDE